METRLKAQHARFVIGVAAGKNHTQAAIDAGYSPKTARIQASKLLTNPNIQAAIADLLDAAAQSQLITKERVLREYARLAFANMQDYIAVDAKTGVFYVDLSKLTKEQAAAIQEVTVEEYVEKGEAGFERIKRTKLKLYDKKSPLDALAKYILLFPKDSNLPEIPEGYEITIGRAKKDQD